MPEVKNVGDLYECELCSNVVEVRVVGGGELFCCGEPMNLVEEGEPEDEDIENDEF